MEYVNCPECGYKIKINKKQSIDKNDIFIMLDNIISKINKFKIASRIDFERMLLDKISNLLDEKQKKDKVKNILQKLKKQGEIGLNEERKWILSK